MHKIKSFLFIFFLLPVLVFAQAPMPAKNAAEIQAALKKLQVLGSVLYIAAHPDDENQRVITYFANGKGYRTGYLSLTRGDGGQNIIGEEQGQLLGVLRTQELLAARRIDGGEQMFSRAYDFGYSKTPEETLSIWDKEAVLSDVVWAIRKFRPDIIITRFATPEKGGGGHGHHTASAMLAHEAFNLAGNPEAFPDQLEWVAPWQPKRLFWNNYWVFRRYQPTEDELKGILKIDIGEYNPLLGKSYGEIASEARSMHKCQAFGAALLRGSMEEYLDLELGDPVDNDAMDGVITDWSRVEGGKKIGALLAKAYKEYQPENPGAILPHLTAAYKEMKGKKGYWYEVKRKELREVIAYCAGLWFEVNSKTPTTALGDSAKLTANYLKRSSYSMNLQCIHFGVENEAMESGFPMENNGKVGSHDHQFVLNTQSIGQQYWLKEPQKKGLYQVNDRTLIGKPENPPALMASFTFEIDGVSIDFPTPVVYKYVDPAIGELYRPFLITPPITVNLAEKIYLFSNSSSQKVQLLVKAHADDQQTELSLKVPEGWEVSPKQASLTFKSAGDEQSLAVTVTPPSNSSVGKLQVFAKVGDKSYSHSLQTVAYDHIPTQLVFNPAETQLTRVNVEKKGEKIGYIMGSGDEIPTSLEQIGYQVDLLEDGDVTEENLKQYDAVIAGIRAYNTRERMPYHQKVLMDYVEQGGTYIVQFNTSRGLKTSDFGPYPLKLSRDRVTVEEAEVKLIQPEHQILNSPNKITAKDFDGWIQERGLYFPNEWDENYTAITECNDPDEDPKTGAMLVAKYGKGHYVYTGYSFFRQLPAGVPGAFRIYANMISLGK